MLVLTRGVSDQITVGSEVVFEILEIRGSQVRVGIRAPAELEIRRGELLRADERAVIERPVA